MKYLKVIMCTKAKVFKHALKNEKCLGSNRLVKLIHDGDNGETTKIYVFQTKAGEDFRGFALSKTEDAELVMALIKEVMKHLFAALAGVDVEDVVDKAA